MVVPRVAAGRNEGRKRESDLKRSRALLFSSALNRTVAAACMCEGCALVYYECACSLW